MADAGVKKENDVFLMHVYLIQTGKNVYYHSRRKVCDTLGEARIFSDLEQAEKIVVQCLKIKTWKIRRARISLVPVRKKREKKTFGRI